MYITLDNYIKISNTLWFVMKCLVGYLVLLRKILKRFNYPKAKPYNPSVF